MKKRTIIALSLFLFLSMNYNAFADEYSQQDVQRYSAYYSNGMEYLKNQQFSSAINEFRKVLRFSPYDETTQSALSGAYLARAQYYRETTKELKKALNDYKSSLFYAKYWKTNGATTSTLNSLASTAQREIESIEKRLNVVKEIGIYKKNNHLNIEDKEREKVVFSQYLYLISSKNKKAYLDIFQEIVKQSKILQNNNK